jgi:hypothetical protein
MLIRVLGALLVIWLAFMLIGVIIKGVFFLAIVGGVLFLATAGYAAIRNNSRRRLR